MRARDRGAALVLLAALTLTLIAAWPVVTHSTERIYGTEIAGRHHDPFTVMRQFDGAAVPAPYLQPATDWLGRALASAIGPIPAYNVVVLWTFPMAALFAYLFARDVTGSRLAAWVAALAFAFSPFHVAQAAYHPHIAQVQWIALYFLALWRVVHRASVARIALFVVATVLVCLSNFYGALIAMSLTPIAGVAFWLSAAPDGGRGAVSEISRAAAVWLATVVVGLIAVWLIAPGVFRGDAPGTVAAGELATFTARPMAYLLPPVDHPWMGSVATEYWTQAGLRTGLLEQQVTLGWAVLILAAIALWAGWRGRGPVSSSAATALLVVAVAAFACSLPPDGRLAGLNVSLPSAWLHALAPMFRSYARFAVVVHLMTVTLAGAGTAVLWRRRGVLSRALALGLIAVCVAVYAPVVARSRDVMPTEAHRWLARGEPVTRVLECRPVLLSDLDTAWLLRRPVDYLSGDDDCAGADVATRLRGQQVSHLLIRRNRHEYHWLLAHPREDLRLRARLEDAAVWDVPPQPVSDPYVLDLRGPFPREYDETKTWRWMGERATWTVVNPQPADVMATMQVELTAFAASRALDVRLNDAVVMRVRAEPDRRFVDLHPLRLRPGPNVMTWTSVEPLGVPDDTLRNGDTRALSVSIGDWRFR